MKLAAYLEANDLTDEDFAREVDGASVFTVRKWRNGTRIPRKDMMSLIVAATNGQVMPNDFFDVQPIGAAE